MATKKTSVNPEFLYVPIANIVVLEQVRSNVNIEADSFKALVQSIKDKGIINSGKRGSRGRGFEGSSENKNCSQFRVPACGCHGSRQSSIQYPNCVS